MKKLHEEQVSFGILVHIFSYSTSPARSVYLFLHHHLLNLAAGIAAPVIVKKTDDPRLARLAQVQPVDRAAALRERHADRDIAAPQIVRRARERPPSDDEQEERTEQEVERAPRARHRPPEDSDGEEGSHRKSSDAHAQASYEDDEDAIAARRAAMRARLQEEERAAAAAAAAGGEGPQSEEESGSEYETEEESDSDDEYLGHRPLAKPVFVPRVSRETLAEREALEREEEEAAERERVRLEQRKEETKEIVAARLAEEAAQEAAAAAGPQGADDIITDDEAADDEEEYTAWKLREMKRLARDREEREKEAKEAEEREKWKAMSEEERLAYLAAQPKAPAAQKPKKSWKFLQKYYHRGAFFQTEAEYKGETEALAAEAAKRDISAPTGEDRYSKEALPEVMQVKNFGRRGRTKWTHLSAEDTTDFNVGWAQNDAVRKKFEARRAGTEQVFTKPKDTKT